MGGVSTDRPDRAGEGSDDSFCFTDHKIAVEAVIFSRIGRVLSPQHTWWSVLMRLPPKEPPLSPFLQHRGSQTDK